jgi:predicted ATPase
MLSRIHLENFKASQDVDIRLAPLTVLSGLNSSGKSTVLHAIGLIRQSYGRDGQTSGMRLSGELLHLGQYRDILSEDAEGDTVKFNIEQDGVSYCWSFRGDLDTNEFAFQLAPSSLPEFVITPNFQFLQADRIVPHTLYPQTSGQARLSGFLGARGQFTVGFLSSAAKQLVSKDRKFPRSGFGITEDLLSTVAPTDALLDQVAGWLQQLSPGARLTADIIGGSDEVLLQFNYSGRTRKSASNAYRPTNVGFGLTYSLPIIVACLAAPKGSLLLIENPEAHLHPRGQAALGELISKCVADGVQVIVETHSDHLLNGIRLSVKRGFIKDTDVVSHFFLRKVDTGCVFVQTPTMLPGGRMSNWPDGFFDQWDKDVEALLD